ncbi:hypothetical protein BJV77DRAFT_1065650 [Russula vinacea]|nr:hypothetical protein BJV77DRAFT_1065650 [Russula vinacea]
MSSDQPGLAPQTQIPGLMYGVDDLDSGHSASESPFTMRGRQDAMNGRVVKQLEGATFQADLTTEGAIFHADPNTVQTVLDHLRNYHGITATSLIAGGQSSAAKPRLPKHGFKPQAIHTNLSSIFSTRSLMPLMNEVEEKCGTVKGLKPDGIGIIGKLQTMVSWEDIEISVESKSSAEELVKQAAMYAHCSLLNNLRRFFTLVIGFNFTTLEAYVFVFHHSGLSSSSPLGLKKKLGFVGLVKHMVGILSIQGEATYGLDITRSQHMFHINNHYYQHVRFLYLHDSQLRGHATVLYSLDDNITFQWNNQPA